MFTGKYFDHWVIKMLAFIWAKELIEYESNNPCDKVSNCLILDFIKHALVEKFLCIFEKATSSNEAWKIMEEEFGAKGSEEKSEIVGR